MVSIENRAFPTIACSLALLAGNTCGFKVIIKIDFFMYLGLITTSKVVVFYSIPPKMRSYII